MSLGSKLIRFVWAKTVSYLLCPFWVLGFVLDYIRYAALASRAGRFKPSLFSLWPVLGEKGGGTSFDRHYIYHTAWAARVLAETKPKSHVDISSSLYFVSIASAFVPMEFKDYRPADLELDGLKTGPGDLNRLPYGDNSLKSLSCMHVIEHIGLGRYGDVLDAEGDLKAAAELKRVLAPRGRLLLALPTGRTRVIFNGHRIYGYQEALDLMTGLKLEEFSLIPDDASQGGLIRNADPALAASQSYACGCYLFMKP